MRTYMDIAVAEEYLEESRRSASIAKQTDRRSWAEAFGRRVASLEKLIRKLRARPRSQAEDPPAASDSVVADLIPNPRF